MNKSIVCKQLIITCVVLVGLGEAVIAQTGPISGGGSSGTTTAASVATACAATQNQLLWVNGTTCTGLTTATNALLVTSATGTPSISATLPITVPVANGGTNATAASITAFNNITGLSAAGTTGATNSNIVLSTSPSLTTPTLGAATATTLNGVTVTTVTAATITMSNTKTLTVNNTLTLSGTDSTTMTFPGTSATVARIDAAQTIAGIQSFSGQIVSIAGTPTIGSGNCGATTNGTIVAGSTNQSGQFSIGASAATSCIISFSATITAPHACVVTPRNATAATAATLMFSAAPTSTQFSITGAVLASTNWSYICL